MGERVGNYIQQHEASANATVATAAVAKNSFICARRYAFEPTWQQEILKKFEYSRIFIDLPKLPWFLGLAMHAEKQKKLIKTFPLEIEQDLHKALKVKAIQEDKTLHCLIIETLSARVQEDSTQYHGNSSNGQKS